MPIARSAVLWGHVLTSLVANLIALMLVVVVAVAIGFRSGAQIEHHTLRRLYLDVGDLADCASNDPRLPVLADRVAAFLDAAAAEAADMEEDQPVSDDLIALLDELFIEFFPCAPRLLELLEERGYTGWTNIRRTDSAT